MRAQCGIQVMNQRDVRRVIQRCTFRQQAHGGEYLLGFFVAGFGQQDGVGFFVARVITGNFDHAFAVRRFFTHLLGQQRRQRVADAEPSALRAHAGARAVVA